MNNENLTNNLGSVCPKCGTNNVSTTKFCIKCGNPIQIQNTNKEMYNEVDTSYFNNSGNIEMVSPNLINQQTNNNVYSNTFGQSNIANERTSNNISNNINNENMTTYNPINSQFSQTNVQQNNVEYSIQNNNENINYFKYILNVILKPYNSFKKQEKNLSQFKNSAILASIIIVFLTILKLLSTMISSVRVTSFWTSETQWIWENLKNVEYLKVIGQNLLIYAGIIIAISGIYFLAGLIIKKEIKFPKLLSATTTAFIPFAIASSVVSPLISFIYSPLGLIITIIGFVYSLIILLELLNDLIVIENKNTRIYFHLICLSIIFIGGGFIIYKILLSSFTSGLSSLFR